MTVLSDQKLAQRAWLLKTVILLASQARGTDGPEPKNIAARTSIVIDQIVSGPRQHPQLLRLPAVGRALVAGLWSALIPGNWPSDLPFKLFYRLKNITMQRPRCLP